ncbi:MAG: transporter [Candidatus Theseobacter exili]|nr:transporter [Candidatus Theseobacter exili]
MKKRLFLFVACLFFSVISTVNVFAGETSHYTNGVEGLKAATLPPPGFYWRMYNVFYNADKMMDANGDELNIGFDVSVYANVNRLIWVTDYKILGADYAVDILVPLIYTDISIDAMGLDDDKFGIGDIIFEPFILSWHAAKYDASFGLSVFAPTGEYDASKPASPGKDNWTGMITLGGTYYFDDEKTWSASILSRYEIHGEKDVIDVTPGNDFHFEWGIGKTLAKVWDVGVAGYCHWQVTDDKGADVTWNKSDHDRVFAIGPEVDVFIPSIKTCVAFRSVWEFGAKDRSEGNCTSIVFTKIF